MQKETYKHTPAACKDPHIHLPDLIGDSIPLTVTTIADIRLCTLLAASQQSYDTVETKMQNVVSIYDQKGYCIRAFCQTLFFQREILFDSVYTSYKKHAIPISLLYYKCQTFIKTWILRNSLDFQFPKQMSNQDIKITYGKHPRMGCLDSTAMLVSISLSTYRITNLFREKVIYFYFLKV